MAKKRDKGQSLVDVAETIEEFVGLDSQERERIRAELAQKYPELEKLNAVGEHRRIVLAFLEWLRVEKRLRVAEWVEEGLVPIARSMDDLVMEYLEIDPAKLETERRGMLDEIRKRSG